MILYKLICPVSFLITTTICSQPTFSIHLRVDTGQTYRAYHNEPLVFTTSLFNHTAQQGQEWNQAADNWLAELTANYNAGKITKDEFDNEVKTTTEGKRQIKTDIIGTLQQPWFRQLQFRVFRNGVEQPPWPIRILGDPMTDSIAILNENGYYIVRHHLSPRLVSNRTPGTYEIRVFLGGVLSDAVTVIIRRGDMPAAVLNSRSMQLRLGNYYLETKNADRALEFANKVLAKNRFDLDGLILRGESYILLKRFKRALADFELALSQYQKKFPEPAEPPEYLLRTIAMLEEKLR